MIYQIENVSFRYPGSDKQVLNGVSLSVAEGEIITVLGSNGAGKSTLLNCMMGLLKPQSGRLLLQGRDITGINGREISSVVGYVPQTGTPSFDFSVEEFVLMGCANRVGLFSKPTKKDHEDVYASLCELGIGQLLKRPVNEISGGERQKALIARAIVSKPRVILFDEPTAHLDFGGQLLVLNIVRRLAQKGYGIVMTTHNPDHALFLSGKAVLFNDGGTLLFGDTDDIVTEENLSGIYKADIRIEYIESVGRKVCLFNLEFGVQNY